MNMCVNEQVCEQRKQKRHHRCTFSGRPSTAGPRIEWPVLAFRLIQVYDDIIHAMNKVTSP